jgi:hypothetical protein
MQSPFKFLSVSEFEERRRAPFYRAYEERASDRTYEKHGSDSESAPIALGILLAVVISLPIWVAIFWLIL